MDFNNIDNQIKIEKLTKYINRTLRRNERVVDWAFYFVFDERPALSVRIDYVYNLHSRNVFDMSYVNHLSSETLEAEFDCYLEEHLKELEELISKGDK